MHPTRRRPSQQDCPLIMRSTNRKGRVSLKPALAPEWATRILLPVPPHCPFTRCHSKAIERIHLKPSRARRFGCQHQHPLWRSPSLSATDLPPPRPARPRADPRTMAGTTRSGAGIGRHRRAATALKNPRRKYTRAGCATRVSTGECVSQLHLPPARAEGLTDATIRHKTGLVLSRR